MDTKLTLKLNQQIIENAKKYAADKKISLSKIIESYLQSLTSGRSTDHYEISPFIKSMATGTSIPTDLDLKKDYADHVIEKHK